MVRQLQLAHKRDVPMADPLMRFQGSMSTSAPAM